MGNLKKKIWLGFGAGMILIGLTISTGALAAGGIKDQSMLNSIAGASGVASASSVEDVAGTVIKAVLSITGLIFLILLVYAGMLWMTARGDEGKVEKSKDIIEAAIIGLAITVSAYAITVFVTSRFSQETNGDPEVTIYCGLKGTSTLYNCVQRPFGTDCQEEATSQGYQTGTSYDSLDACKAGAAE